MDDDIEAVNDWWIPKGDIQLFIGLQGNVKAYKRPVIDGHIAWRYDRIAAALEFIPDSRRNFAIDIGAHIGMWARYLARDFKKVVAFEPMPRHLACLRRNMLPEYNHVEIQEIALSDGVGRMLAMIQETEVSGRSHVWDEKEDFQIVSVEQRTLDSFNYQYVDFIKIDVEGYERKVLLGGQQTIEDNHPVIVIEQLGHEERYGEERDSALALLKSWGAVELRDNMKGDYYMGWKI